MHQLEKINTNIRCPTLSNDNMYLEIQYVKSYGLRSRILTGNKKKLCSKLQLIAELGYFTMFYLKIKV